MTAQQPLTFGPLLKRYRDASGLTQEELAGRAGLGARTISDLERGVSRAPYGSTIRRLADALELSEGDRAELQASARHPAKWPAHIARTGRPAVEGGFLGAVPSKRLVARGEELGRVLRALEGVAGGSGQLVLLAGEPGIGKTRLAQQVSSEAWERGFLVTTGRCYEAQSGTPFYPFFEALATLYEETPGAIREEVPRRWPQLSRLLPDHFPSRATASTESQEELHRLLRALTGFIREISATVPVALLLDDLHWVDEASLDLLQYLARHTRGDRILFVGAYRDTDAGRRHRLRKAVRDLDREQLVERIDVRRLGRKETSALMADWLEETELSEEFAGFVYGYTEGNPFFTVEALQALIERGDLFRREGHWIPKHIEEIELPESVSEAIVERVSHLGSGTQKALEEASVLGQAFGFEDLRSVSDRDEEEVEAALEEAADHGIVRTAKGRYAFNHPLTQQTLYTELSPTRRRRLHRAAGEGLDKLEERVRRRRAAELEWHFVEGGAPARALLYALLAGAEAEAILAHGEAERHYRTALELAEEVGDESAEVEAMERLGGVLATTVRYEEALSVLERASEAYRDRDAPESAGRAEARIAQVHFRRGTANEGITRLSAHLESLDRPGAPEGVRRSQAALYCGLARLYFALGRYGRCQDAAERAANLSREVDDARLLADAEMVRGSALYWMNASAEAVPLLEAAASLAEECGASGTLSTALLSLHWAYTVRGEFERGRERSERGAAVAEKAGDTDMLALHTSNLGLQLFYLGDWRKARAHLERGVELTRDTPTTLFSCVPPAYLGVLRRAQGAWEEASRCFSETATMAQEVRNLQMQRYAHSRLAELEVLRDRPTEAIAHLEPWLEAPERQWMHDALLLPILAEAYAETGAMAGAEEAAERAVTRARTIHNRVDGVEALRVQGKVLARQGRTEEAHAALQEALGWARSMPYPYAEGRILHEYGLLHAPKGAPERAWERLCAALAIFRRLGASKDAERTDKVLREFD